MPGAARLLWHLHSHGVPMALATSTPRATYEAKMCGKAAQSLCSVFQASTMPPMDPCLTPQHSCDTPVSPAALWEVCTALSRIQFAGENDNRLLCAWVV